MTPDLCSEELTDCLDEVAAEVLAAAGSPGPPIDAYQVAAAIGLTIARDDAQTTRARRAVLPFSPAAPPVPTILLKNDPRPERRHWAVAHEIGEHFAFEVFSRLAIHPRTAGPGARERVASNLAGRILLSTVDFRAAGAETGWWLPDLKEIFATASHELIALRMLDVRDCVLLTVCDQGRITWRRRSGHRMAPSITPEEGSLQAQLHAGGGHARRRVSAGELCGWSVHEPQWKREILALAWDETGQG